MRFRPYEQIMSDISERMPRIIQENYLNYYDYTQELFSTGKVQVDLVRRKTNNQLFVVKKVTCGNRPEHIPQAFSMVQ